MGALTVEQLIIRGLQDIGIAAAGEPVQPEDLALGQQCFNMIVDDFKTDRLMIYQVLRNLYPLTAGTAKYSIGPGGDWPVNTAPVAIVRAGCVQSTVNPVEPLETPVHVYTDEEWARVGLKNLTSTINWGLWYETSYSQGPLPGTPIGCGNVYPYPIDMNSADQMALYLPVPIDEVKDDETGLATTIYVPPGYRRVFATCLSMDMCNAFEMDPKPSLTAKWNRAMKMVKRMNIKPMVMRLPRGLTRRMRGSGYNILTNQ